MSRRVVGSLVAIAAVAGGLGWYSVKRERPMPELEHPASDHHHGHAMSEAALPPLVPVGDANPDPATRAGIRVAFQEVESFPMDTVANARLGLIYELSGYPESARVCYQRATLIEPANFRWHYLLAKLERRLGESDAAAESLHKTLSLNARYPPAQVALGEIYLEQGLPEEARKSFEAALDVEDRSVGARLGLGRILAAEGSQEEAIATLEAALELAPGYAPVHAALGLAYRENGDLESAQRHLELARDGHDSSPDADPVAYDVMSQEVGVDHDYRTAQELLSEGRLDEAIELLSRIVEIRPDHYGAQGALGGALMLQRRDQEALAAYEKALTLSPDNIDFLRPCSLLLYRAQRYDEAHERLRRVLDLGGDHYDDHHILGVILIELYRSAEAIGEFERALELKPDHAEARKALLHLLRREVGRAATDAEAVPYMRRLVELEPQDVQTLTMLGGTLQSTGDLRGALAAYERALLLDPNLPEVIRRRDDLRARLGS